MHPDPAFADRRDVIAIALMLRAGPVHIFAQTVLGPMVALAPLTGGDDGLRFHISRRNRIAPHLHSQKVLLSHIDINGYISPDWYAEPADQVPTWNYHAVEVEGVCRSLDQTELRSQVEKLSQFHEAKLRPKPVWTVAKIAADKLERMLDAICGFEVTIESVRMTAKFSQNKSYADRQSVIEALRTLGEGKLASRIRP